MESSRYCLGDKPQRGKVLLEQWTQGLWQGQDPPTSTEYLAQSLGEYKYNAEKENSTFFTASHILLLLLQPPVVTGGIWERQALAHTALVYNNSSAARWCQKSVFKDGKISDESHNLILQWLLPPSIAQTAFPLLSSPLFPSRCQGPSLRECGE